MAQVNLSPNFTLHELTKTVRRDISNTPDDAQLENMKRLCVEVMEPVRAHFDNRPIIINSGFRNPAVNKLVGGSLTSEHMDGRAADFVVHGLTPLQVCRSILPILHRLPVNQLIYEFGQWTHISICALGDTPRRQVITAYYTDGKLSYSAGILDVRST